MTSDKQKVNILVVGPNNSGKTTFLETLSMTPLVEIDYRSSGEVIESNSSDCVEYGAFLTQDVEVELRNLSCRNTEDFDMMDINWAMAERGADGVIMMVPADDPQASCRRIRCSITYSSTSPCLSCWPSPAMTKVWCGTKRK